jgi:Zn-dependent protease with chaperone function
MRSSRTFLFALALLLLAQFALADESRDTQASDNHSAAYKAVVDQVFYNEAKLYGTMKQYRPLVETYIQNYKPDAELGQAPSSDKYFLGRLVIDKGITQADYGRKQGFFSRVLDRLDDFYRMNYMPTGFMQLLFLNVDFDQKHYDLNFRHREFLGQVRCLVFDAVPKKKVKGTHFVGRIWVEDQNNNIVRINGTYLPQSRTSYFFHFDSWRLNVQPDAWLPAFVYTEESDAKYAMFRKLMMRGQTRLWDYDQSRSMKQDEFTSVVVDPAEGVVDRSSSADNAINPVESKHQWEREAEDNVLERVQRAGLVAPEGEVSKVLDTVVNNLVVTNKLNIQPEVRCRVLLTTPLESFTVGHTIVVSRGLLDVLPDEASLAAVLAHELGHIVLGH